MRRKSCRSWSSDGRTEAPGGEAGPAGRAEAAAAVASPGEGSGGGGDAARLWHWGSRPTPHNGGRGRAGRRRWAPATSGRPGNGDRSWARAPPPSRWGRGGPGLRVGAAQGRAPRGARARACFLRAVTRALCGPPLRVAARRARPRWLSAVARGLERLPGRAPLRDPPVVRRAPCCWLVAPSRVRAGRPLRAEDRQPGGRATRCVGNVEGWALPALVTSGAAVA